MKLSNERIYCSLDIETSGFDPVKNEVLEVGFVLFSFDGGKVKIIDEYTRVFKPALPVSSNILGLTGISQTELDNAEKFAEHRDELQDKLKDTVIVGHNVNFDIKFLEALGIKFSGQVVDTLDLVQFLLPTHHSYNLENLMHYFGVDHKNAHRALADAKAALAVLEKMMEVFSRFPVDLQGQINKIGQRFGFVWTGLTQEVLAIAPEKQSEISSAPQDEKPITITLSPKTIYNFPFGKDIASELLNSLTHQKQKVLLVLPKISQVVKLWKNGQAKPVFPAEFLFDDEKFTALLNKNNLVVEEAKFILKILVWKATNWQTDCIFDLNLSFFGGQFKRLVTGRYIEEDKTTTVLCCDLQAYTQISREKLYSSRFAIIIGLDEFEQYISGTLSLQASWTYIAYLLKGFYNPETDYGKPEFKDLVINSLAKADLFFGIVNALLKTDPQKFQYVIVDQNFLYSDQGQKIAGAAEHFALELSETNKILKSAEIQTFADNLKLYFQASENYVKWVELAPNRCLLMSAPIDISQAAAQALSAFPKIALADSLGSPMITTYFKQRLGLGDFGEEVVNSGSNKGQLVLDLKKPSRVGIVKCKLEANSLPVKELFDKLSETKMPAAVLFGTVAGVKEFYEQYYQQFGNKAFLVAQNNHSGSNRMFHNFSIHNNSLLLATAKFVLKHISGSSSVEPVEHLPVKTLFILSLPFDQYTHPYQQAVSARFSNPFEQYSLPRAIYNLQILLKFFNTEHLEQVYICDSKLAKGYGGEFREFMANIEGYEM